MMIRYKLADATIDKEDIRGLIEWLGSAPRLTKDSLTTEFEKKWSRWVGVDHSVFCNSGSSANLLMYNALLLSGRLKNKKVVVPSAGWATSVAPAIQLGYEPLMCEADPDTFGLDLNHLETLLKRKKPGAVFLVHVLGVPHKMKDVLALKERYGFFLFEDACASIGSSILGKKVGAFGDMASFSFYYGHQASTIEGGMVSTGDRALRNLLLMLRSHGWGKDLPPSDRRALEKKHGIDGFHAPFVFYEPGFNLRSTDLNAFLGLRQLEKMNWVISRRWENHDVYLKRLEGLVGTQKAPPSSVVCSISFCALAKTSKQRRRIVESLASRGVETRLFTAGNLGRHPFWIRRYGAARFPVADRLYDTGFFLPNNPLLTVRSVDAIARIVREAL